MGHTSHIGYRDKASLRLSQAKTRADPHNRYSFAVPPLLARINLRAGFVFGATSFIIGTFFWFFLPETKGSGLACSLVARSNDASRS